jgi:hypothetical protein
MEFVKTPTAEKPHAVSLRSGMVLWTVCGQIIDLGRTSVRFTSQESDICGVCRAKKENTP